MLALRYFLTILSFLATRAYTQDNLDLILYENDQACTRRALICHNTAYNSCCRGEQTTCGSGYAQGGTTAAHFYIYASQGAGNNIDYCAIRFRTAQQIPSCVISTLPGSVGGIIAFRNNAAKMTRDTEIRGEVIGEEAFVTDKHFYIISHDKMTTLAEPMPKDVISREKYFKEHADKVVERKATQEVSVVQDQVEGS